MLNIEYSFKMKDSGPTFSSLDSNLVSMNLDKDFLFDNVADVENGIYDNINEGSFDKAPSKLSKNKVKSFAVKTFPRLGPYGMFTTFNGEVNVKIPIEKAATLPKINSVIMSLDGDFISYEIIGDINVYEFIRISFKQGNFTEDFMVSEHTGRLMKPIGMSGEYKVTCVGYSDEIKNFSNPSRPINFVI